MTAPRKFDDREDDLIQELRDAGRSIRSIAAVVGRPSSSIQVRLDWLAARAALADAERAAVLPLEPQPQENTMPRGKKASNDDKAPIPKVVDSNRFLELDRGIRAARVVLEEAQGTYRAARKRMKDAGFDLKEYALYEQLNRMEPDAREALLRGTARMAAWLEMPLGEQGGLFGATDDQHPTEKARAEHREFDVSGDGYKAGKSNAPRDSNPQVPGSPLHAAWDTGWLRGEEAMKRQVMEMGEKPASTRRKRAEPGDEQAAA